MRLRIPLTFCRWLILVPYRLAMRALIGRLQIPILKVAILDKRFFSNRSHPARKLLNDKRESIVRRWQAAKVLGGIGAKKAVKDLIAAVKARLAARDAAFDAAMKKWESSLTARALAAPPPGVE